MASAIEPPNNPKTISGTTVTSPVMPTSNDECVMWNTWSWAATIGELAADVGHHVAGPPSAIGRALPQRRHVGGDAVPHGGVAGSIRRLDLAHGPRPSGHGLSRSTPTRRRRPRSASRSCSRSLRPCQNSIVAGVTTISAPVRRARHVSPSYSSRALRPAARARHGSRSTLDWSLAQRRDLRTARPGGEVGLGLGAADVGGDAADDDLPGELSATGTAATTAGCAAQRPPLRER